MSQKQAISIINKHDLLLTFPVKNSVEPRSLWSVTYPKSEMRWEWDDSGDNRIVKLWQLREELSRSGEVVYVKWFQGRATFFSQGLFTAMLAVFLKANASRSLSREAREILDILESDSPLSTKALKKACGLQGRLNESTYTRAMKELWSRLLIVGFGEIDEGAFPSLAIGASKLIFESLYDQAGVDSPEHAETLEAHFKSTSPKIQKYFKKVYSSIESSKLSSAQTRSKL